MKEKISIIIPVFNEIETINELIKKVKEVPLNKEIIIIDDFSTDGTKKFLEKIRDKEIISLFHKKNYGKGFSIRTALKQVSGDIVIIQDADLEYNPQEIPKVAKLISEKKSKVVYGTRFPRHIKIPKEQRTKYLLANKILTLTSNILYQANITDEATCYKAFDSNLIKSLDLKCKKFEFCSEVTAKVRKKGYKILEVPISYNPRNKNQGKKISYKDAFVAFWTLIKYRFIN